MQLQIDTDKSIHEMKQKEIQDRLNADKAARNKRIEKGLLRIKIQEDRANSLKNDYTSFQAKNMIILMN